MMGQVAESDGCAKAALGLADKLLSDRDGESSDIITVIDPDMISSFVKIMTICAEYLTLSNSVIGEKRTVAEEARRYITENLDKKIGITDICKRVGCSKSTLLTTFKKEFGTTVNSFINDQRLRKAEGLLYEGKMSVAEVSCECGFSDQSYFSKVFATKMGCAPGDYRRRQNIEDTSHG
jgi:AraC-like DNA-binding protein